MIPVIPPEVIAMTRARLSLVALPATLILLATGLPAAPVKEPDAPFRRELLQVAKDYKSWGRVDDEMRFSPWLCFQPDPALARFSASTDPDTHGRKLYSLFAKDRTAYVRPGKATTVAVGQVVVKESWAPEETTEVAARGIEKKKVVRSTGGDTFYPYATRGDKVFKASKPAGLFVMMKLDPKTPGTDDGWVYGTVSADGKTVTSAGKVESCMKCHQDARHDRLFGLPTE